MVRDPSAWSLKSKTRLISVLFSLLGDPRPCFPGWCHNMVPAEDRASVCFYLRTPGDCHNSYSECHLFRGCSESRNFDWSCNNSLRILRSDLGEVTRGDQEGRRRGKFWPCLVLSKSPPAAKQEQR
ncbi:hypothetical protein OIU84_003491 [Salix udensis]|uniref:Uncharacterized protein n=1 Tax=Salix udensis TaxID=889485 RepID=A0AAD6K2B1_9ROSI|nr:hypothetical protein OIU84_003491 [Salix udensis]